MNLEATYLLRSLRDSPVHMGIWKLHILLAHIKLTPVHMLIWKLLTFSSRLGFLALHTKIQRPLNYRTHSEFTAVHKYIWRNLFDFPSRSGVSDFHKNIWRISKFLFTLQGAMKNFYCPLYVWRLHSSTTQFFNYKENNFDFLKKLHYSYFQKCKK